MKLTGTITFLMDGTFEQRKATAILRINGEIALDFDYRDEGKPFLYNVVLRPAGKDCLKGEFDGGRGGPHATSGPVTCSLYKGANGYVLSGRWTELGHLNDWFAELSAEQKPTS